MNTPQKASHTRTYFQGATRHANAHVHEPKYAGVAFAPSAKGMTACFGLCGTACYADFFTSSLKSFSIAANNFD